MANWFEKLFGQKESNPGQQAWESLNASTQGRGAGGTYGQVADSYRDLLSDNSADAQAFEAPLRRQFSEDILPQLAENFAGMGSGALNSSSFRNAGVRASTDLAERLGAIRAGLRQQGREGLSNIGLQNIQNAPFRPETSGLIGGLLEGAAPALGAAAGMYFGGPMGAAAGSQLGSSFSGRGSQQPGMSRGSLGSTRFISS